MKRTIISLSSDFSGEIILGDNTWIFTNQYKIYSTILDISRSTKNSFIGSNEKAIIEHCIRNGIEYQLDDAIKEEDE